MIIVIGYNLNEIVLWSVHMSSKILVYSNVVFSGTVEVNFRAIMVLSFSFSVRFWVILLNLSTL